jgi:polyisoprenoid-binding protein YceI
MKATSRIARTPAHSILKAVLAAGLGVAFASAPASASMDTYTIDPEHTSIGFRVTHLVFSKVPGFFRKFEGSLKLDPADLTKGSVSFSIDAASIDTNEPARDKHLRSDAFFDVDKFPKITFKSTQVRKVAGDKIQVDGNLTIRGITKLVTLDAEVLGIGPDGLGGERAGFEARTRINRQDYGVSFNDVVDGGGVLAGNDVDILLNVEARKLATAPPARAKSGSAAPGSRR